VTYLLRPLSESHTKSTPHPRTTRTVLTVIALAVLLVFIVSAGSAAIQITGVGETTAHLILAACYAVAIALAGPIAWRMRFTPVQLGLARPRAADGLPVLWFLPLIVIEAVGLLPGISSTGTPLVLSLILLTVLVGIGEELYFRGLIVPLLNRINVTVAVWVSAAIFAVGHLPNALQFSGLYVALQFVFAFVFGLVTALLVVRTGSLWVLIAWHACHDFIGYATGNTISGLAGTAAIIQVLLMAVYAAVLLRGTVTRHPQTV